MLKPLVKRGLSPSPYRLSWRSVQGTKKKEKKKRKKARLGWTFHPHPKRPPFTYTFYFVHVGWGYRRNHPCQVSSQSVQQFRLPKGSKFTIYHRLGQWLLQQCYALTCYTVMRILSNLLLDRRMIASDVNKTFLSRPRPRPPYFFKTKTLPGPLNRLPYHGHKMNKTVCTRHAYLCMK